MERKTLSFDSIRFPIYKLIRAIVLNLLCCMNFYLSINQIEYFAIVYVFQDSRAFHN